MFTKNRDRLLTTERSRKVMAAILAHREVALLLSDEHFSVDGTLVKAWASMKSFQPKAEDTPLDDEDSGAAPTIDVEPADPTEHAQTKTEPMPSNIRQSRTAEVSFRGEKRTNATHASTTDPARGAALQEIHGHGCQLVLHRACAHGEPHRSGRARRPHPG